MSYEQIDPGRNSAGCGPMLLRPAFKHYLWGGERLVVEYGKETEHRPVAESWELSCHPDGLCAIDSGIYKGATFADALSAHPEWVQNRRPLNGADAAASVFPVLIKLIDAKINLSLQVHPDDAYASVHANDSGKNEAWYIIDCEPGAELILGLKDGLPPGGAAALIKGGGILDHVNYVKVKPGDCFCVQAGLLHAIGGGILVAEVQQSSNVTYRVFDYGRPGDDGNPRPLHLEHAANVTDASARAVNNAANSPVGMDTPHGGLILSYRGRERGAGVTVKMLADWKYFKLSRIDADGEILLDSGRGDSFHALLVIDGSFLVESAPAAYGCPATTAPAAVAVPAAVTAPKGACVFVPAGLRYTLSGRGGVLLTTL